MLRKMCRYMTKEWLVELCDEVPADPQRAPFTASISEVLAVVFDNEVSAAPLIIPNNLGGENMGEERQRETERGREGEISSVK